MTTPRTHGVNPQPPPQKLSTILLAIYIPSIRKFAFWIHPNAQKFPSKPGKAQLHGNFLIKSKHQQQNYATRFNYISESFALHTNSAHRHNFPPRTSIKTVFSLCTQLWGGDESFLFAGSYRRTLIQNVFSTNFKLRDCYTSSYEIIAKFTRTAHEVDRRKKFADSFECFQAAFYMKIEWTANIFTSAADSITRNSRTIAQPQFGEPLLLLANFRDEKPTGSRNFLINWNENSMNLIKKIQSFQKFRRPGFLMSIEKCERVEQTHGRKRFTFPQSQQ